MKSILIGMMYGVTVISWTGLCIVIAVSLIQS